MEGKWEYCKTHDRGFHPACMFCFRERDDEKMKKTVHLPTPPVTWNKLGHRPRVFCLYRKCAKKLGNWPGAGYMWPDFEGSSRKLMCFSMFPFKDPCAESSHVHYHQFTGCECPALKTNRTALVRWHSSWAPALWDKINFSPCCVCLLTVGPSTLFASRHFVGKVDVGVCLALNLFELVLIGWVAPRCSTKTPSYSPWPRSPCGNASTCHIRYPALQCAT